VLETSWRILLFALVAGVSPIAIVSTLVVLTSRRGRANGLAFAGGFLVGQAAAFAAAYFVGSAATTNTEGNERFAAVLELAFGIFLLALAWPQRRRPEARVVGGHSRTRALLDRLRGLRPETAFSAGTLVGVGGVKRLSITIVAGATVGIADLSPLEDLAAAVLYVGVAGLLVWLPVAVYALAGAQAEEWIAGAEHWLTANERRVMFLSTVLFGLLLTSDALVRLL
jgi:threonine/homoserine/homoserine lactone efflux protein